MAIPDNISFYKITSFLVCKYLARQFSPKKNSNDHGKEYFIAEEHKIICKKCTHKWEQKCIFFFPLKQKYIFQSQKCKISLTQVFSACSILLIKFNEKQNSKSKCH